MFFQIGAMEPGGQEISQADLRFLTSDFSDGDNVRGLISSLGFLYIDNVGPWVSSELV